MTGLNALRSARGDAPAERGVHTGGTGLEEEGVGDDGGGCSQSPWPWLPGDHTPATQQHITRHKHRTKQKVQAAPETIGWIILIIIIRVCEEPLDTQDGGFVLICKHCGGWMRVPRSKATGTVPDKYRHATGARAYGQGQGQGQQARPSVLTDGLCLETTKSCLP